MAEEHQKDNKAKKENIQQKPDRADGQQRLPETPEPPQRKYPLAKPRSDKSDEE